MLPQPTGLPFPEPHILSRQGPRPHRRFWHHGVDLAQVVGGHSVLGTPGGPIAPGKVFVDMSSISPIETRRFAERVRSLGADYLDAPVSGGDVGAREARLSISLVPSRTRHMPA